LAVEIDQRHAHIAYRADGLNIRIVGEQSQKIIGKMDQATLIDYFGARGTVDVHLPSVDPFAAIQKASARSRRHSSMYSVTQAPCVFKASDRFFTSAAKNRSPVSVAVPSKIVRRAASTLRL